jgi:hypothetical protein
MVTIKKVYKWTAVYGCWLCLCRQRRQRYRSKIFATLVLEGVGYSAACPKYWYNMVTIKKVYKWTVVYGCWLRSSMGSETPFGVLAQALNLMMAAWLHKAHLTDGSVKRRCLATGVTLSSSINFLF